MMVRDEVEVLERCLTSVRPYIAAWTIMDTGSVDGTPELAASLLADVPGSVIYAPWRDFGTNRTLLMAAARGQARHLLLLDADMELVVDDGGDELRRLRHTAYALRHESRVRYDVARVVDGRRRWSYVGATHEVLHGARDLETAPTLEHVRVIHHADGSQRTDKLHRDRELLERAVRDDPSDRRSTFYLAQTYRDLGDRNLAEELYTRRAEASVDDEESFYAAFQAGVLRGLRDPAGGLGALMAAWSRRPIRAEPLHAAAQLARRHGWSSVALAAAQLGSALPTPEDRLFVHIDVYDWALRAERGFALMSTGDKEGALDDFDAALAHPTIDPAVADEIEAVRWRCLPSDHATVDKPGHDPLLEDMIDGVRYAELHFEGIPDWPRFNPSITADAHGYSVVVRSANYELLEPGHRMLDNTRQTRTVNHLLRLSHDLEVVSVHQLVDATGRTRFPTDVRGFEDCRLIVVDGVMHAVASVRDHEPDGWWTMALLRLDGHHVTALDALPSPVRKVPEKNWVPFVKDGELRLVYKWQPLTVLDSDGVVQSKGNEITGGKIGGRVGWRGGTQGIAWGDGWLFVVHEVEQSSSRRYRHRFVEMSQDGQLRASQAFSFTGHRIEFAAGLTVMGDQLVISFGVGDRVPVLAMVPMDRVKDLFEDLDDSTVIPSPHATR
jgi:predicted GH43/DUF377 family glycosyl hydrolase